ncbi:hypothetical protein JGU66_03475 [Myxococcaceae bacterium JPH2]|nr:hypothetical protein [Myxococcaceae bacterium JPH2]
MMQHVRVWAVLVLAGMSVSCGVSLAEGETSSSRRQRLVGAYCDAQTLCDLDEVCDSTSNTCVTAPPEPDPCETVQCWPWEMCVEGTCVDDPNNCMLTGCDTGYTCEGGTCVEDCLGQGNCGTCDNDFNCEPGYECKAGKCVEEEI